MSTLARVYPRTVVDTDPSFVRGQLSAVADWITETGELAKISGEQGTILSPEVLWRWLETAEACAVGEADGEVIALATLCTSEARLPPGTGELCHLIVRPDWRRRYRASCLILELTAVAKELGYERVAGRMVYSNTPAFRMLTSLSWPESPELAGLNPGFHWHEKRFGGRV